MKPVFMMNNYSMRIARELVSDGSYPAQHLWGYPAGSVPGYRPWLLPSQSLFDLKVLQVRWLRTLRNGFIKLLGDPLQMISALRASRHGAIVYAADQRSPALVLALKRLGLVDLRIAVLVHHPPVGWWERWVIRAADELMVLNVMTQDSLRDLCSVPVTLMFWGPDLHSSVYIGDRDGSNVDFTAAGKTNRDYSTLRRVAAVDSLNGHVFDGRQLITLCDGHEVAVAGRADYPTVIRAMRASAAVVVSLRNPEIMAGLTEVADAIALDRPVIVTASPAFPYDVSGSGAGTVVAADDTQGLSLALSRARSGELGGAGVLGETYNMDHFAKQLELIVARLEARL